MSELLLRSPQDLLEIVAPRHCCIISRRGSVRLAFMSADISALSFHDLSRSIETEDCIA